MSKNLFNRLFLNEKLIFAIIVVNSIAIFLQESVPEWHFVDIVDVTCTFIFIIEMIVKLCNYGFRQYWSDGWNCMDFILVLMAVPSVVALFAPTTLENLSFLLVLRILRIFRFFRAVRVFPGFSVIVKNFWLAIRQCLGIFFCFFILIVTFALIGCCFLKEVSPDYFATPLDSIYTIFRLCTVEGWYEIPDTVAMATSPFLGHIVRLIFCLMLIGGGIIGMSLINSIFVDAMVSDNNDDVKEQLSRMEKELDEIKELMKK
ncbi:MAG: ion transporter [Salinivirgaceae bacterium]|nr:ion transporter [Salinivirgaceae bacterium]